MVADGIILGIAFIIIGIVLRFKPTLVYKHHWTRHGFKAINHIIPWKRMIVILKFLGLAFLLMGIAAILLSFGI